MKLNKMVCVIGLAVFSSSTSSFAAGSADELIEVSAPDESNNPGAVAPPILIGGLIGGGSQGGSATPSSKGSGAVNEAAKDKAQKEKEKGKDEGKKDEQSVWDVLLGFVKKAGATLQSVNKISEIFTKTVLTGVDAEKKKYIIRDKDTGNIIEEGSISKCQGLSTNSENPCTEIMIENYSDPKEPNVKKYMVTISAVKAVYEPLLASSDENGMVARTVDNQFIRIAVRDANELRNVLNTFAVY